MKQKIRFEKNVKNNVLTILESSEVDPGIVMPLLEVEYSLEEMATASEQGLKAFTELMRNRSFFPTSDLCSRLFEATADFFKDEAQEKLIIDYNDVDAFPKEETFQLDDDDVELEQILEEDGDTKEDEMKEIDMEDDTPVFRPEDTSEHEN